MQNTEEDSFPCKQSGCTGVITQDPQYLVAVRTGCASSSPAAACPVCGRLYWPHNGLPVRNRQYDNAFVINGSLENRPMNAAEKKELVKEYTDSVKTESDGDEWNYVREDFGFLVSKGHANDCPAKDNKGECICGNSDALKWIAEHPGKEVALAE